MGVNSEVKRPSCISSMVTAALEFKSQRDPGFGPLAVQGERRFSWPRLRQLDLVSDPPTPPPPPPFVCTGRTQMCSQVSDPIFICRKRVGFTAGCTKTRLQKWRKKINTKSWVAPYYGCSLSAEKTDRISRALHLDKKLI